MIGIGLEGRTKSHNISLDVAKDCSLLEIEGCDADHLAPGILATQDIELSVSILEDIPPRVNPFPQKEYLIGETSFQ